MRRVLPIVLSLSLVVSGLGFVPTAKMVPDASAAVAGKLSDASQGEILESLDEGNIIDEVSGNAWKSEANANPISPSIFCADPTCVEYNEDFTCMEPTIISSTRRIRKMITIRFVHWWYFLPMIWPTGFIMEESKWGRLHHGLSIPGRHPSLPVLRRMA